MIQLPKPHGDKLQALLDNSKLPKSEKSRVVESIVEYNKWRDSFSIASGSIEERITKCVKLLNDYKNYIEIDLIFSSKEDFLYRQKGQLKLDNTVLEEFLSLFINYIFNELIEKNRLILGPTTCISGIRFDSSVMSDAPGGGIELRQKDQDFAISRKIYIQASNNESFTRSVVKEANIAYL